MTRGYDWVIDIWGADHQGHIPRMKAVVKALGEDPDKLTVISRPATMMGPLSKLLSGHRNAAATW